MPVSFGQGVSATPGYTPTPFPTNSNARGIVSATGAYNIYPNTPVVVGASNTPTATFDQARSTVLGQLFLNLEAITLPAGAVGPDGWYELYVEWSCSSSAVQKTLTVVYDTTNPNYTNDSQTTNQSSSILLRISNRNNTSANIASGGTVPGGHASPIQSLSMDLSQEHSLNLWCGFGSAPGASDFIRVERWHLTAYNPPVYSSNRIQYGTPIFHGCNGHWDYLPTFTAANIVTGMKTMGFKMFRVTDEGTGSWPNITSICNAFNTENSTNHTGLQIFLCLDISIVDGGTGQPFINESVAYSSTFNSVRASVLQFAPLGVKIFECGNEMDTKSGLNIVGGSLGGRQTDFSNTLVPIFRAVQRAAIDAVHSVSPTLIACSNAYTVCSVALSDMLWYNYNPDGSTGSGPVRWDATSWHNYEDYGPLTAVTLDFSARYINIYEHLNRNYKVPIFITEWNSILTDNDARRANWASRFMGESYTNRYKYNIAGVMVYQLLNGSPWGVINNDGSVVSTFGTTVQSFIAANPDTGT